MAQVRTAIDAILRAHTISPAMLVNRRYDVLQSNAAALTLMGGVAKPDHGGERPPNLLRLLLSQDCLRPLIENWPELSAALIRRVTRESEAFDTVREDIQQILDDCVPDRSTTWLGKIDWMQPNEAVMPIRFRVGNISLALFTTITTLGTPTDINAQELRIEAFHPADRATEEFLSKAVARAPR